MFTTILLTFAMALGAAPDDACTGDDRPDLNISLATFGPMGLLRTATITEEVDRVWARHGVRFAWRIAAPSGAPSDDGAPIDVWVQLIQGSPDWRNAHGDTHRLGSVRFENGQPLDVVRIPVAAMTNAIRDVYRNQGAAFHEMFNPHVRILERALGRVIAHELGHILLRSPNHTRSGLMSANVRGTLFISTDPVDLGLDRTQAAELRTRPGAPGRTCGGSVARK